MKEKKTKRIFIRVNEEQKIKLQKRASYFQSTLTKYILKCCFAKDPVFLNEEGLKELRELRKETNKIISALNLRPDLKPQYSGHISDVRNLSIRAKL